MYNTHCLFQALAACTYTPAGTCLLYNAHQLRLILLASSYRQEAMKPNSQLTLTAFALFYTVLHCCTAISCAASGPAAFGPSPASARPAVLPPWWPAPAPESVLALKDCEQDVLDLLGWQQAYNPAGYNIDAALPLNCSTETWQAMGCLRSLVNLTLTDQLPDLPDSWAGNGSFPALQTLNFSSSSVAGSLPSIWAVDTAFPELRVFNLSLTQLSGTLPTEWGFPKACRAASW